MIEKMQKVHIISTASNEQSMLDELRKIGIVHLGVKKSADKSCLERFQALSKTAMALKDYSPKECNQDILNDEAFEELFKKIEEALESKKDLTAKRGQAVTSADRIRAWGAFDPQLIQKLKEDGIKLHFYRLDKKTLTKINEDKEVQYIKLASVEKMETIAVIGQLSEDYPATEFVVPKMGLEELEAEVQTCDQELVKIEEFLEDSAQYLPSFNVQMLKAQNEEDYSSVKNTVESDSGLIWLTGYVPNDDLSVLKETASKNGWAYGAEEVEDGDEYVPTKVKYNKLTGLITPVFDILGTVPGYKEYDISFWFLGFFTLFFAMIIGDAGYGVIFLIGAIALTIKLKRVNNAILLLYVLSVATIVWGALTGTWLGLKAAMDIPFLKALVIPSFANYPELFGVDTVTQQNAIMKFCFIIGTVQLSLACVMNIRKKLGLKDLSWVADLGWLAAIVALYFVVLFLVIGEQINLVPVAIVVGIGFLLVVCFGGMEPGKSFSQGLKAGLGNAFTVFLNTISAFGNIMSYIRLFAVGMASLAIAQSFNDMAANFSGVLVVVAAIIMIIGHVLNIVMGFLSVVVHGVRLNLLEFSGQLGMEWSGIAYNPFKKIEKIRN